MKALNLPTPPTHWEESAAWLQGALEHARQTLADSRLRETLLSWARLATFAAFVTGLIVSADHSFWGGGVAVIGAVGFLLARRVHRRARDQATLADHLVVVLEESKNGLQGELPVLRAARPPRVDGPLPSSSNVAWRLSRQEVDDLDLYAEPLGLFGVLHRCATSFGADQLAHSLEVPLLERADLQTKQAAVRHLRDAADHRFELQAALHGLYELDRPLQDLYATVKQATPLPKRLTRLRWRLWSLLALPAMVALSLSPTTLWWPLAWVMLGNGLIIWRLRPELLPRLQPWVWLDTVVRRLQLACWFAVQHLPTQGQLGGLRGRLQAAMAPDALPGLARMVPYVSLLFAGLVHTLMNLVTLWDVHVLIRLHRHLDRSREDLLEGLSALAQLDALLSLATFAWEREHATLPELADDPGTLQITNGRHPLIQKKQVVPNTLDMTVPERVWIITGSNMSGKSTFLRMVGASVVLAQAGGAVLADGMRWSPLKLVSDLRIRDDLSRKESYFLAEVRQVHRMVDLSEDGEAMLGLVDEPFRGTNSDERLGATLAVTEALARHGGFFLIATHDRQVAALEDGEVVANYHFQEELERETLCFDYRLRSGPATQRNAIKVLQAEGYPAEVVSRAMELAARSQADEQGHVGSLER